MNYLDFLSSFLPIQKLRLIMAQSADKLKEEDKIIHIDIDRHCNQPRIFFIVFFDKDGDGFADPEKTVIP